MIFADTSALFSLYNQADNHHSKATIIAKHLKENGEEQITSNIIIGEVLTLLSMRVGRQTAIDFGKRLEDSRISIIFIEKEIHNNAWLIFQKIKDKDVSFADCTSFAVMEHLTIRKAFSFDQDFTKQGFELEEV